MAKLSIVGTGPGDPDYVTPAARKAVQEAQLVIGASRSLKLFHEDIHGETQTLTATNVNEMIKLAVESTKKGKLVVLLSSGDPGFSGLLCSVLRRLVKKDIELNVVAGISSMQVAAARLCFSWDQASLMAFHEHVSDEKKEELAKAVKAGKTVFLLPEPNTFSPRKIAVFLLKTGVPKETPVAVCQNLTMGNESVIESTLAEASKVDFGPLSIMVIKGGN